MSVTKRGAKTTSVATTSTSLSASKSKRQTTMPTISSSSSSSLSLMKAKTQSQEDLTKVKDRPSSKGKPGAGGASGVGRRPIAKESHKNDKPRDKIKTASVKPSSSAASSSGRSSALSRRPKEGATKSKSDVDKVGLEGKIRDLMSLAKNKDSEIRSLKTKLDQMMHLLNKQRSEDDVAMTTSTPRRDFANLVKLESRDEVPVHEIQNELTQLQEENMKLREQVDSMMISMRAKESEKALLNLHQQKIINQDVDALSNDDGLSSSLEDVASAASGDALRSTSVSRSTSTENLLDDISNSGTTSSNGITGYRGDERIPEDCISESSSVTVACLTERIHQMKESHISTNEELEATVQELTDLQKSVPELTIDNNRLQEEKDYLVEKLSVVEKKLKEQTTEATHLRALVSDHFSEGSNLSDLKQQYLALLTEREQLLRIQESLNKELQIAIDERKGSQELVEALKERMRHLERELDQSNTAKSLLDKKLKDAKDEAEEEQSEVLQKLEEELQFERQRVDKFLKTTASSPDDNTSEVVDAIRQENQDLEDKLLLLEEDFNLCQNENEKLDARIADLEEEQEAADTKTKKDLSELSELIDRLQEDLRMKQVSLDEANETLYVMEDSVEQHIAVKKHDNHIIQQLQNQISNIKEERFRLEKEIQQLKKEKRNQSEEWKQFQADLQMAVIIANDMKAETQSEVMRLRDDNQALDEEITKLRVENEQLRRKRISNVSATSASILEAAALRQSSQRSSTDISALREAYKRRASENSPGVQSLIKSFDNQKPEPTSPMSPTRAQSLIPSTSDVNVFSPPKPQTTKGTPSRAGSSPITATVSPLPRHHSMSSITPSQGQPSLSKLQTNSNVGSAGSSKPGTPDSGRSSVSGADLSQLSSLLRRNSATHNSESRKPVNESRKPLSDILDRIGSSKPSRSASIPLTPSTPASSKHRTMSISTPSGDPLASLARRYGGSKRNALLKWCQEKTQAYQGIDITNFSTSWADGLALCGLLHSYLPAHIPYDSLQQTYFATSDEKTISQLQAKNFRLAFAAAESVGIDPTLTTEEMTTKERPDWQHVMSYVTQIYKYFET